MLVGFAAETESLLARARDKMTRKNLDLIVANDISSGVFGSDSATVHILCPDREPLVLQNQPKSSIADRILDMALVAHRTRRIPPQAS